MGRLEQLVVNRYFWIRNLLKVVHLVTILGAISYLLLVVLFFLILVSLLGVLQFYSGSSAESKILLIGAFTTDLSNFVSFIISYRIIPIALPVLIIWLSLASIRRNGIAPVFLDKVADGIDNLNLTKSGGREKIFHNISYFKDFVYYVSPFRNPYSIPMSIRLLPSSEKLRKNKNVLGPFEKRMKFIINNLDESSPVMAFSKDKEQLKDVADKIREFSKHIKEGDYLKIDEAESEEKFHHLFNIFDIRVITTAVVLGIITVLSNLAIQVLTV